METRSINFSVASIHAINKYLSSQPSESMDNSGLTTEEREALLDAYGMFREEVEELEMDEAFEEAKAND